MNAPKFNIGDRVKVIGPSSKLEENFCPLGMLDQVGIVTEIITRSSSGEPIPTTYFVDISPQLADGFPNWAVLEEACTAVPNIPSTILPPVLAD